MNIEDVVLESIEHIDAFVTHIMPYLQAEQARALFDKEGALNGRQKWKALAESTVKRKGHSRIMYDTGELYGIMSSPSTYSSGNWEGNIPEQYMYADEIRKFSDIGTTEEDLEDIANKIAQAIQDEFS